MTVEFKEFGIRLNFTPTIAGDIIRLKVRPEVSSLDFANGVTLSGFRIPALTTRRAETDVELRDGQSFAIAGLLDNMSQNDSAGDPVPQQDPDHRQPVQEQGGAAEQTELMVLITPRLVRPLDPDEVPPLPTDPRRFIKSWPARTADSADARRRRRARRCAPVRRQPAEQAVRPTMRTMASRSNAAPSSFRWPSP